MQHVKNLRPLAALWLVAAPTALFAHHSLLNYDDSQLVDVEGEVTSVYWGNPHILIEMTGTTEAGEDVTWTIEGGPVNQMERRGVARGSVAVGDTLFVSGIASDRGDEQAMMPVLMTLASGDNLILDERQAEKFGLLEEYEAMAGGVRNSEAVDAAIRDADGIFRVWTNDGWIARYRVWGESTLPLTESARIAQEGWVQVEDDLALRCIKAGMPEAQLNPFPIEFIEQGDNIVMRIEEWENVRTIYMDGSTSEGQPASPLGYSVGHWEGNTLVIETDNINAPFFDDRGTPQSEAVRIVERFTLSEDETRLDWLATVYDDATFTEPMEMPDLHWNWVPGESLKTYECTPASAGTPWGARRSTD
jgi:hypothetical protein